MTHIDVERLGRAIDAADAHTWDLGGSAKWAEAIVAEYNRLVGPATSDQYLRERIEELRQSIERWVPQHASSCAGQDDEAECICGTSEVYRAALSVLAAERMQEALGS